jgi:hypothetical protein
MALDIFRRREIPVVVAGVVMLLGMMQSYLTIEVIDDFMALLKTWALLIMAFAVGLAAIRMFRFEYRSIARREHEWIFSVWIIFFTFATWIIGLVPPVLSSVGFNFILVNIITVMDGTMWSLGGFSFFIGTFRAYRVRNIESLVMVVATIIMIAGLMPGLPVWVPAVNSAYTWVFNWAQLGGRRGLLIAEGFGVAALGIRVMLGRERGFFS